MHGYCGKQVEVSEWLLGYVGCYAWKCGLRSLRNLHLLDLPTMPRIPLASVNDANVGLICTNNCPCRNGSSSNSCWRWTWRPPLIHCPWIWRHALIHNCIRRPALPWCTADARKWGTGNPAASTLLFTGLTKARIASCSVAGTTTLGVLFWVSVIQVGCHPNWSAQEFKESSVRREVPLPIMVQTRFQWCLLLMGRGV